MSTAKRRLLCGNSGNLFILELRKLMYVGAACHPQPKLTGVASTSRRRPCFEGIDVVVRCLLSVNVVIKWELNSGNCCMYQPEDGVSCHTIFCAACLHCNYYNDLHR